MDPRGRKHGKDFLQPAAEGSVFLPVDEGEIRTIEDELDTHFPEDYRQFLKNYGASTFSEIAYFNPVAPLPDSISSTGKGLVDVLYGGESAAGDAYSLARRIRYFVGRVPDSLIPIGDDGGGSQICLAVKGEDFGKVYYWDLNNEPLDEDDYLADFGVPIPPEVKVQNIHLIASSFAEFLDSIEVDL